MQKDKILAALKAASDDPLEQILMALALAEKHLGYIPKEMRCYAALASVGIGGQDTEGLQMLTGIIGKAIAKGVLKREEVLTILDNPEQHLDTLARAEEARHKAGITMDDKVKPNETRH